MALSLCHTDTRRTGLQENWHYRRGLAHLSAHGGNHAGRDGRTPIDDPRLLASQRSARDQQVSPGNDKKQTPRAGEARGCHPAWGCVVGKQIKPNPLAREVRFSRLFGWGGTENRQIQKRLLDPNGPRSVFGVLCKPFKRMAGTTGLEPATSAVTGQRSNQLNYVPTRQINQMRIRQCLSGFARFAYIASVAQPDQNCSCFGRNGP